MTVSRQQIDNICVVTIERPEHRNAVDAATALQLAAAFREFDADPRGDVAILTGASGHFCAGADLKAYARGDRRQVTEEGDGPMGPTRLRLSKPVIAAVEGYAVAGGCELALWCDLRVVSQSAIFGIFCRRLYATRPVAIPNGDTAKPVVCMAMMSVTVSGPLAMTPSESPTLTSSQYRGSAPRTCSAA